MVGGRPPRYARLGVQSEAIPRAKRARLPHREKNTPRTPKAAVGTETRTMPAKLHEVHLDHRWRRSEFLAIRDLDRQEPEDIFVARPQRHDVGNRRLEALTHLQKPGSPRRRFTTRLLMAM